jgi:WD40 repeat protein
LPGRREISVLEGHRGFVTSVSLSVDGRRVLSGGGDRTIRLWSVPDARQVRELIGHKRPVWSVAFVPGGKRAVSAGYDEVAKVWDLETGEEITGGN